jgi:hypothetical protein
MSIFYRNDFWGGVLVSPEGEINILILPRVSFLNDALGFWVKLTNQPTDQPSRSPRSKGP